MPSRLSNARRIVVRAPNWVGDVLMSTPALALLRRLNREAEIVVLARPVLASLLDGNANIDAVWPIEDQTRSGWIATLRRLRTERFDWGLLLTNSFQSALLLRLGGVKILRGFARDSRGPLLAEPVELRPEFYSVHEVTNYLRLLTDSPDGDSIQGISLSALEPGSPPLDYRVSDPDRREREERLQSLGIDSDSSLLAITPGAAFGTAKRWSPERYAEAAARLAEPAGMAVVVMGSEPEADTARQVCEGIRDRTGGRVAAHNLAGRWTLRLVGAVLERARLHLTNDSGPMHLAAALGTPLVAVFGPTDRITTAPWSPNARIVYRFTGCSPCLYRHCPLDHGCMEGVTVDQVVSAAQALLGRPAALSPGSL